MSEPFEALGDIFGGQQKEFAKDVSKTSDKVSNLAAQQELKDKSISQTDDEELYDILAKEIGTETTPQIEKLDRELEKRAPGFQARREAVKAAKQMPGRQGTILTAAAQRSGRLGKRI